MKKQQQLAVTAARGALALSIALAATPAIAQSASPQTVPDAAAATDPVASPSGPPAATDPISVDFVLAGYSDYRFRGLSLSNKDAAFQPSLTITHQSGVYVSAWGSNIAANGGANIEVDLTLGISHQVGSGFNAGAFVVYYFYPGATSTDYFEIQAGTSHAVGPGTVGFAVTYAPKQASIGDVSNIYVAANGSVPIPATPLTLTGSFGIENGAFGNHNKLDWSIGVTAAVKGFTLGASYIDTSHTGRNPLGSPTAVLSISRTF
jgi:uncharacterized protein (TIGR02001 family)